eukprot:TRINITY_DN1869_c0_g2_i1.p1 TRINITY_DN1869_c0_g2~~TRINITY_DN1869_c0_g2_i1.p1  ORF type:complete len:441 (-),score=45.79 TRINITY_DN1869_c0_g2_i1:73-1290(-)
MVDVDDMKKPLSDRAPPGSLEPACQREGETYPLLTSGGIFKCYSLKDSHCTFDDRFGNQHLTDYDQRKLTTVRVFFVLAGTVFANVILWVEMLVNSLVFVMVFLSAIHFYWDGLEHSIGKETDIREFIASLTTLVGLLLVFYTSMNVKRWWVMRMRGVGEIWHASSKLTLQISNAITRDPEVLDAISRYACASLAFVFMMRSGVQNQMDSTIKWGLLTEVESHRMSQIPVSQRSEAIWSWLGRMVWQLNAQGLVTSQPQYASLMSTVDLGRDGAQTIKAYLDTPLPMSYVHLLGLMVKLHNIIVAILMGAICAVHAMNADGLGTFRTMFRALFMPFIYNALLLINSDLSDPFSGDATDFPDGSFVREIRDDAKSIASIGAAEKLPAWFGVRKTFKEAIAAEGSNV